MRGFLLPWVRQRSLEMGSRSGSSPARKRSKSASGWKTPVQAAWSDFMLKNVASRDFSVIVLIFAVIGKLDWFLWMAAIGSVVFSLLMLWVIRPSSTTRA